MIRALTIVLTVIVVTACGGDDEPVAVGADGGDDDRDTIEGEYVATDVTENDQPKTLVEDTTIRLRLQDGELSASAGCNTIGGGYATEDGVLQMGAVATTEMGCDAPRHDQDTWLAEFLSSRPLVEPVEEGFVLRTDTVAITFVDHSIVEPDRDLVATTWIVDGHVHGAGPDGAVSSAPDDAGTLTFDPNGFVVGNDGCNSFGFAGEQGAEPTDGLRYTVDGDRITFSGSAVSTLRGCDDVDTERYRSVLTGTVTWEIDRDRLTLLNDGGEGVTYRARD